MSDLFESPAFEPSLAAAQARIAAVRPGEYARTRNALDGAVSRLSPYITHGFVSLPQVLAGVREHHRVDAQHKFVYELGWREFFHHVWQHQGEGIFRSLHQGVLPDAAYARELPADIRQGATGLPVVDQAVRTLYETGYLHNHARMWLASYVVHLRKVHWRAGADWLYAHLLDGDLASNHLSWQWVAATGSHKPYLFNAENVARYAPRQWHCRGSLIDTSYAELEAIACDPNARHQPAARASAVQEPALHERPPPGLAFSDDVTAARKAWVVHPFALRKPDTDESALAGAFFASFHARWPWSEMRWRFVHARMQALCGTPVWVESAGPPDSPWRGIVDPHLKGHVALRGPQVPRLFAEPQRQCRSFSQFFKLVGETATSGS